MINEPKEYSTFDIARILDINRDRIHEWLKRGYIPPSIEKAAGQGTVSRFSLFDVIGVSIFDLLLANGWSRDKANEIYLCWQEETRGISPEKLQDFQYFYVRHTLRDHGKGSSKKTINTFAFLRKDLDINLLKSREENNAYGYYAALNDDGLHDDFTNVEIINVGLIIKDVVKKLP